jgi:hypothetical protein
MSFFSAFNKLRHFPEFHDLCISVDALDKTEDSILQGLDRAFGPNFRKYAGTQKEGFSEPLTSACDAGGQQATVFKERSAQLRSFTNDLLPLLAQETEMSKWRDMATLADTTAKKSRAICDKAEEAFNRAKTAGRPVDIAKTEAAYGAAKLKAESDESSAADQQQTVIQREPEYQQKFLESFVTPFSAAINVRFKASERLLAVASDFQAAGERIVDYTDPTVEKLKQQLQELEEVVMD